MLHHYLNSYASVCVPPPQTLNQRTRRPWTRLKDHLRERGDPLCYVSAREWNNMESSSANNLQWRSFSICCLTKGKIRTDDMLSLGVCSSTLQKTASTWETARKRTLSKGYWVGGLTPSCGLVNRVLAADSESAFFSSSCPLWDEVKRASRNLIQDLMITCGASGVAGGLLLN